MPQLFSRHANTLATMSLYLGAIVPFAVLIIGSQITRSPWNTRVAVPLPQPSPFSHKHHVQELGIDCRFCHVTVEKSPAASIPGTEVCMTCHVQVWPDSPNLEVVRDSFNNNIPLQWNRVASLPDFVFFDHSVHVSEGISCNHCHGAIQDMQITYKARPFTMAWCLDCHNSPEEFLVPVDNPRLSPADQVFVLYEKIAAGVQLSRVEQALADGLEQRVPRDQAHENVRLMQERGISKKQLMDCYSCHR